jgi:hypothetical protein
MPRICMQQADQWQRKAFEHCAASTEETLDGPH